MCVYILPVALYLSLAIFRRWASGSSKRAFKKAEKLNDRQIEVVCDHCGGFYQVNSIYGGSTQKCQCGNDLLIPMYAEYVKDRPVLKTQSSSDQPDYNDLESAIEHFSFKAKRIQNLDIDEDEKEMLLMKLQEKKEQAV
jgi:hypothetical protein